MKVTEGGWKNAAQEVKKNRKKVWGEKSFGGTEGRRSVGEADRNKNNQEAQQGSGAASCSCHFLMCVYMYGRTHRSLPPPSTIQRAPAGSLSRGDLDPSGGPAAAPQHLESDPGNHSLLHWSRSMILGCLFGICKICTQFWIFFLVFFLHILMTSLLEVTEGKHKPSSISC